MAKSAASTSFDGHMHVLVGAYSHGGGSVVEERGDVCKKGSLEMRR
jgi:hypothetical protein